MHSPRLAYRHVIALLGLLSSLQLASATNSWFARTWQTYEGLPDDSVSGVAQAADGFLWVGTLGGLVRFDGVRFEEFAPKNVKGISDDVVRAVAFDHQDRLWLAMNRGFVVCLDRGRARVFGREEGLPDAQATGMAADGQGAVWIADHGGINRIKDGVIKRFNVGYGPTSLGRDTSGRIWFANQRRVGIFRDEEFHGLFSLPESKLAIAGARDGGVWISGGKRLWKYREGENPVEAGNLPVSVEREEHIVPTALLEDRSGGVWIGTAADGLFRVANSKAERVPISYRNVTCLFEDGEGNLWAGTRGGGLNRVKRRSVELIGIEAGLPVEWLQSLSEDTEGALWMVTQDGSLLRQRGGVMETISANPEWPGYLATCVEADARGAVWVGTRSDGLVRLQPGQLTKWNRGDGLLGENVACLLSASNGDLWIVTAAVQRWRSGELQKIRLPRDVRAVRAVAEDAAGTIWLGTSGGHLLRVEGDKASDATARTTGEPHSIRCLHATADGSLWIGYAGFGLGRLKDGKYARLTTRHGLSDDRISQIAADDRGRLWLAGNRGIFQVRLQELADVAEGRAARVRSVTYGPDEGLPSLQASFDRGPAATQLRDGSLCFATRKGLAVVRPDLVDDEVASPPVVLKRMTVDDEIVALYDGASPLRGSGRAELAELRAQGMTARLPPNHRKVEFDYAALSFSAPENVHFRHRLEGFDEAWIDAGTERTVSYGRLPAGEYRFRVAARHPAGEWNELNGGMAFVVTPFLWETWWFRSGTAAAFTLGVFGLARYVSFRRLRTKLRLLEHQAALEKERARIARDLHDDLGSGLTQIALLSELGFEQRTAAEKSGESLRLISSTARRVIQALDETVWAVNPRNDTLSHLINYIGQFAVEFLRAAGIRCRVDLLENAPPQPVPSEVRHHVFLAVKEALNNVVRHASAKEVRLHTTLTESWVNISLEDDGRGFSAAPDNAFADGLRNMRQRMEAIGGQLRVDSTPGTGTRISLSFPRSRT